jgi:putative salt-induced outer membrane protein
MMNEFNRLSLVSLMLTVLISPLIARAEDAPKKPWKDSAELSYMNTTGNTQTRSTAGKNTYGYDWAKTTLEVICGGLSSKNNGVKIAEKYYANEKMTYRYYGKNYAYERFAWDRDPFAGFDQRYDSSVGLGRELLSKPKDVLILELGGGYTNEQRTVTGVNDFVSGRAYSKYTHSFTGAAYFSQDAEYIANFTHSDDYRFNAETALMATLTNKLGLKISYQINFVNKPPEGKVKTDTQTGVALVANF